VVGIREVYEEDLEEICLMSLQDIGNQRAGDIVMEAVFDDSMRPGVRQNILRRGPAAKTLRSLHHPSGVLSRES
jgi:hypothetical protein